jgi:hypothetical protein
MAYFKDQSQCLLRGTKYNYMTINQHSQHSGSELIPDHIEYNAEILTTEPHHLHLEAPKLKLRPSEGIPWLHSVILF